MGIDWAYSIVRNQFLSYYSPMSLPFPRTHCKGPVGDDGFPRLLPIVGNQNGEGRNQKMVLYSGKPAGPPFLSREWKRAAHISNRLEAR